MSQGTQHSPPQSVQPELQSFSPLTLTIIKTLPFLASDTVFVFLYFSVSLVENPQIFLL